MLVDCCASKYRWLSLKSWISSKANALCRCMPHDDARCRSVLRNGHVETDSDDPTPASCDSIMTRHQAQQSRCRLALRSGCIRALESQISLIIQDTWFTNLGCEFRLTCRRWKRLPRWQCNLYIVRQVPYWYMLVKLITLPCVRSSRR